MPLSSSLLNIAIAIVMAYILFLVVLFLIQTSLIFPAPPPNLLLYEKLKNSAITLDSDGRNLQGWRITGANQLTNVVIIYFGGNGEDVAATIPALAKLPASVIYAFNYRGYGLSTGTPGEAELYQDAFHIFNEVRQNNPNKKIAVMGYSLGSAIAGHLAGRADVSYLILFAPLFSIERIAQERFFNVIPSRIVTNKFRLSENLRDVKAKTLVICAGTDKVIPYSHSEEAYLKLTGTKEIHSIDKVGHNELFTVRKTYDLIENFLNH